MENTEDVIEITYCAESGFLTNAASLAEGIKQKISAEVVLIEGHAGIYEVVLNNEIIYTHAGIRGPLPSTEEVVEAIINKRLMEILMGQDNSGGCSCGCE